MTSVITVLEAEVDESNWQLLEATFAKETKKIPKSIKQTFLVQSQSKPRKWRIITQWRSQTELDKMRASETMPVGVRVFKIAGAQPRLDIWNSKVHKSNL